jgi:hypothetical protein
MIPKIIYPDSFDFGMPSASLIEMTSKGIYKGYMEKRAALFDEMLRDFKAKPDHSYIHLITTGAVEKYGPNNNGDGFNKEARIHRFPYPKDRAVTSMMLDGGLSKYHDETFTKMAAVYKNHQNRHKGGKPSGYIVKAAYNKDMDRGELIVGVDNKIWEKELEKLASEQPIYFSMAADVPRDVCSYCGSTHKRRSEYCEHLTGSMLGISKEGHQIYAINDTPLFHDISGVIRPADKLAFGLRKVANGRLSGADLAEIEGLVPSLATVRYYNSMAPSSRIKLLNKLAAIEKKILAQSEGGPLSDAQMAFKPESGYDEVDDATLEKMRKMDPGQLFGKLKHKKILLPVETFFKLLTGDGFKDVQGDMSDVKEQMPGIFGKILEGGEGLEGFTDDSSYEPDSNCSGSDRDLDSIVGSHSLEDEPVKARVIKVSVRGGKSGGMPKKASATCRPAVNFLAREYAKYALSFADGLPERQQHLTIVQLSATSNV